MSRASVRCTGWKVFPMSVKVLVVDDSMMVRRQVGAALGQAGFDVEEAKDGIEAL